MMVLDGFLTFEMDEKKQKRLYNDELKRIEKITTWQEAMEEYGRIAYLQNVGFKPDGIITSWWDKFRIEDALEKRVSDRRRKCCYYKNVSDSIIGKEVLKSISYYHYFVEDYKVGKNAEFKKAKDGGSFVKGFFDMATKLGDTRSEKEITDPFVRISKNWLKYNK